MQLVLDHVSVRNCSRGRLFRMILYYRRHIVHGTNFSLVLNLLQIVNWSKISVMSYKTLDNCLFCCHILRIMLVQNYQFVPNFQKIYVQIIVESLVHVYRWDSLARLDRGRCLPSQSPKDILHPSWRKWPWHGSYWCKKAHGTIFTFTLCGKCFFIAYYGWHYV